MTRLKDLNTWDHFLGPFPGIARFQRASYAPGRQQVILIGFHYVLYRFLRSHASSVPLVLRVVSKSFSIGFHYLLYHLLGSHASSVPLVHRAVSKSFLSDSTMHSTISWDRTLLACVLCTGSSASHSYPAPCVLHQVLSLMPPADAPCYSPPGFFIPNFSSLYCRVRKVRPSSLAARVMFQLVCSIA